MRCAFYWVFCPMPMVKLAVMIVLCISEFLPHDTCTWNLNVICICGRCAIHCKARHADVNEAVEITHAVLNYQCGLDCGTFPVVVTQVEGHFFNGPFLIARKTNYALDNDFGGVMIWEVGQDCNSYSTSSCSDRNVNRTFESKDRSLHSTVTLYINRKLGQVSRSFKDEL